MLDILSGAPAIARFLYGVDDAPAQRRVRRLIATGAIPAIYLGGRLESRRSWLEAVYAAPVRRKLPPPSEDERLEDLPKCAVKGCRNTVRRRSTRVGRPPKYCERHAPRGLEPTENGSVEQLPPPAHLRKPQRGARSQT
jgi:hypothetical protein